MNVYDVEVESDDVEDMLDRVTLWMDDSHLSPFVREAFGDIMQESASDRFSTESSGGTPWAPLKPATLRRRVEAGYPAAHPINVRSGKMRSFLIHSVPQGGSAGSEIEYSWPERATGELYMKILRAQGWTRVDTRPVIDVDATDVDDFVDRAFHDLERSVR